MRVIKKNNEPQSLQEYKRIEAESAVEQGNAQSNARYSALTRNGDSNGVGSKAAIQLSLLEEQGYICAYCMKPINQNEMKIEHWFPQEKIFTEGQKKRKDVEQIKAEILKHEKEIGYKTNLNAEEYLDLDYGNMLGVCKGEIVEKSPDKIHLHCDSSRSKSNKLLFVCPTKEETLASLKYGADGKIYSDNSDIADDINNEKVLNLNAPLLKRARGVALAAIYSKLNEVPPDKRGEIIQKQYEKWNSRSQTITYQDVNGNEVNSTAYFPYCQIVVYFLKKRLEQR